MRAWFIFIGIVLLPACISFRPEPSPTLLPTVTVKPTQTPLRPSPTPVVHCVSGECLPSGDLPGWKQIFTDDFAGTVSRGDWSDCSLQPIECKGLPELYQAKWWAYTEGWPDTSKNGTYSPSQVLSVKDGVLDIFLHTEKGVHRVAAVLPLIHGNDG